MWTIRHDRFQGTVGDSRQHRGRARPGAWLTVLLITGVVAASAVRPAPAAPPVADVIVTDRVFPDPDDLNGDRALAVRIDPLLVPKNADFMGLVTVVPSGAPRLSGKEYYFPLAEVARNQFTINATASRTGAFRVRVRFFDTRGTRRIRDNLAFKPAYVSMLAAEVTQRSSTLPALRGSIASNLDGDGAITVTTPAPVQLPPGVEPADLYVELLARRGSAVLGAQYLPFLDWRAAGQRGDVLVSRKTSGIRLSTRLVGSGYFPQNPQLAGTVRTLFTGTVVESGGPAVVINPDGDRTLRVRPELPSDDEILDNAVAALSARLTGLRLKPAAIAKAVSEVRALKPSDVFVRFEIAGEVQFRQLTQRTFRDEFSLEAPLGHEGESLAVSYALVIPHLVPAHPVAAPPTLISQDDLELPELSGLVISENVGQERKFNLTGPITSFRDSLLALLADLEARGAEVDREALTADDTDVLVELAVITSDGKPQMIWDDGRPVQRSYRRAIDVIFNKPAPTLELELPPGTQGDFEVRARWSVPGRTPRTTVSVSVGAHVSHADYQLPPIPSVFSAGNPDGDNTITLICTNTSLLQASIEQWYGALQNQGVVGDQATLKCLMAVRNRNGDTIAASERLFEDLLQGQPFDLTLNPARSASGPFTVLVNYSSAEIPINTAAAPTNAVQVLSVTPILSALESAPQALPGENQHSAVITIPAFDAELGVQLQRLRNRGVVDPAPEDLTVAYTVLDSDGLRSLQVYVNALDVLLNEGAISLTLVDRPSGEYCVQVAFISRGISPGALSPLSNRVFLTPAPP